MIEKMEKVIECCQQKSQNLVGIVRGICVAYSGLVKLITLTLIGGFVLYLSMHSGSVCTE